MGNLFGAVNCLICSAAMIREYTWETIFKPRRTVVCKACLGKFELIPKPVCQICSRSLAVLPPDFIHGDLCGDCHRWEKDEGWKGVLDQNVSLYHYNELMKELIALFKYRGDYAVAEAFGGQLKTAISGLKHNVIVPIPLSGERLQERGFNQSEALIVAAGFEPVHILVRKHTEKQSKKSREARMELGQIFQIHDSASVKDKHILLVDDIYTTGSTLRHAAKALKEAGAVRVCSLTIAR